MTTLFALPARADRITAIQSPQPVLEDPVTGTLLLLRGQTCNGLEVAFFATRWAQGAIRDDGTPVTLQAVAWNIEDCSVPPQTDDD